MDRKALFDAVRPFAPGGKLLSAHVPLIDAVADAFGLAKAAEPTAPSSGDPPWMRWARTQIGVTEIVGPKHNPTIIRWAQEVGAAILGIQVNDDETPWCGLFVARAMTEVGLAPPKIAVRAAQWGPVGGWGRQLNGPRPGCVLVFSRSGGGHVGFYVGEDATHFHVLGGNQSNGVNIARIAKSQLVNGGMRWPQGPVLPPEKRVFLTASGAPAAGSLS